MKRIFLFGIVVFCGIALGGRASAATVSVVADSSAVKVGDTVTLSVVIDTSGAAVNAAQVTLQFPTEYLEVLSVDSSSSIFNFWVEGPSFSNETGYITFLGGATNGFNGQTLQLLRIYAKMKVEGSADILFLDGVASASDGSGTNVLTSMRNITITAAAAVPAEAAPEQITREATPAETTPSRPVLNIPLYPDPELWYNTLLPFLASWELSSDISAVATSLDQNPTSIPRTSEGLFDNKMFKLPDNGIWYLHVRFKNNQGWGEATSYRLAVDTLPPTAYQIEVSPALETDVPRPIISYGSADQLSGLVGYSISVDGNEAITTTDTTHTLAALAPGKHVLNVEALDQAGNGTSASVDVTTVPIDSPTLNLSHPFTYVGEGDLSASGTVAQGIEVVVEVRFASGEFVVDATVTPDQGGTWNARFEQPLKRGEYTLTVTAKDERGATSLPVQARFDVIPHPLVTIVGVPISSSGFFLTVITLMLGVYAVGWQLSKKKSERRGWHVLIAQRDVNAAFDHIQQELTAMIDRHKKKKAESSEATDMVLVAKRLNARIKEVKQYILDHIEGINT